MIRKIYHRFRSAITGRFVDEEFAEANPDTTVKEADDDVNIDTMVRRFLNWPLPDDFSPDAGITFEPEYNVEYMAARGEPPMRHRPVGTNLLSYNQAEAMVRHLIEGLLK